MSLEALTEDVAVTDAGEAGQPDSPGRYSTLGSVLPELVVISLFMNILALALPLVLLQVYDRILPNSALGTLGLLVLGVGGALLVESLLKLGRSYITGWVSARFEHLAGVAALKRMLHASIQDFERVGGGAHLERIGALNTVKDFYAGQSLLSLLDLPFVVIYLGVIWILGGWLVAVPMALLFAFLVSALILGRRLRAAIKDRMTYDDRRVNFIIEVLNGAHTLKSMAMEAQMMRRYERLQETCGKGNHAVTLASSAALGAGAFFAQAVMVATVGAGSYLVATQAMSVGGLAACTLLAGRSLQPVQRALGIWTRFQTIRLARQRLSEVFAMPEEAPRGLPQLSRVEGVLSLKDAAFRFKEDGPDVLHDLNLEVRPGECVGISGGNGSGKSTLLALMSGALRPSRGQVMIDGRDLRGLDPQGLKRHLAYLPQQGELFRGTMLENITMYDPELNEAAMVQAENLGLGPVVAAMPLGYDTMVGDGAGEILPRGIRQRIAVARALLPQPQVVLFDEANTAVDGAGDNHLKACLEDLKGERTLVLVTHRPSLLKLADRVYDLQDGTLTPRPEEPVAPPGPRALPDPVPEPKVEAKSETAPDPKPEPRSKPEAIQAPPPVMAPAPVVAPPTPPARPPARPAEVVAEQSIAEDKPAAGRVVVERPSKAPKAGPHKAKVRLKLRPKEPSDHMVEAPPPPPPPPPRPRAEPKPPEVTHAPEPLDGDDGLEELPGAPQLTSVPGMGALSEPPPAGPPPRADLRRLLARNRVRR